MLGQPRKHLVFYQYEESGNYIYSISKREIEKVALGINLPQVAFKTFNDAYVHGLEFEPADPKKSAAYRLMRRLIARRDRLCRLGLEHPEMMTSCLFHQPVTAEQRRNMEANGWTVIDMPRNPFLS